MKFKVEGLERGWRITCLLCVGGDSLILEVSDKEEGIKLMKHHQLKVHKVK